MKRVVVAVFVAALALPGAAWAHATLLETAPAVGRRLPASPRIVLLTFDQSVKTLPNGIRVYDSTGRLVSGQAHGVPGNPRAIEVGLRRLPKGAYTVRWSAISNDSHVGHGVYTFGVRVAAPALSILFAIIFAINLKLHGTPWFNGSIRRTISQEPHLGD